MDIQSILKNKGHNVLTITPDTTVAEAIQTMVDKGISALVVSTDGRRIAGILSDRDVIRMIAERGTDIMEVPVEEVMTTKVVTCMPSDRVAAIMNAMTELRIRHIPVVDDNNLLTGLVSIGDVVKWRLDEVQFETEAMREYITRAR